MNIAGIVLSLLSAVFSSSKDLFSKRLAYQIDGMTSTFASFGFALPFYCVVLAALFYWHPRPLELGPSFLLLVFLRASTDVMAEGMKMYAFSYADISVVACFFSLSPLLLLITSPLITGDPLTLVDVIGIVLVVGGSILLVYRPSDKSWGTQKKGILLALAASFFFSLNSAFDRLAVQQKEPATEQIVDETTGSREAGGTKEEKHGDPTVAVFAGFAMTLMSGVMLLPFIALRRDRWAALKEYQRGLWVRGFLEVLFMSAKLWAIQLLTATEVVTLQRSALVLSIIGGRVFFKEPDFARRLTAGVFIVAGVTTILWWKKFGG